MNITLGVFDLFAFAVPGSLYLGLLVYIGERLTWIDTSRIFHGNTALIVIAAVVLSYVVGHITYGVGYLFSRIFHMWNKSLADATDDFLERVPTAQGRPFLQADRSILQAVIELHQVGAAVEISRLRAIGLMLRNSAPVFFLGAIVAMIDAATGYHPIIAGCCVVIFALAAMSCLERGAMMRHWANTKTLQYAFWIPDIDSRLNPSKPSRERVPGANKRSSGEKPNDITKSAAVLSRPSSDSSGRRSPRKSGST